MIFCTQAWRDPVAPECPGVLELLNADEAAETIWEARCDVCGREVALAGLDVALIRRLRERL